MPNPEPIAERRIDPKLTDPRTGGAKSLESLLVGDCMLGRLVNHALEREPLEYPWGDTLPIFRSTGWRIRNLECVLADGGEPWSAYPEAFHFRSAEKI